MARSNLPSRVSVSTATIDAIMTTNATTTKYMPPSLPSWKPPMDRSGRVVGRPFELGPNIQPMVYIICSRRMPTPRGARARKTPRHPGGGEAEDPAARAAAQRRQQQGEQRGDARAGEVSHRRRADGGEA